MKNISQDYFNETVKSNMELFDMSIDDAIKETVDSFVLEGVDLSNIVQDLLKYEDGHPVVVTLEKVAKFNNDSFSSTELISLLKTIQLACSHNLALRKLLASKGAVNILLNCDAHYFSRGLLETCVVLMEALGSVIVGQSTVFEKNNIEQLVNEITEVIDQVNENCYDSSKFEFISSIYVILKLCCLKNENNREILSQTKLISQTIKLLSKCLELIEDEIHSNSIYTILQSSCAFLRHLTFDDDMSVEFGYGSQNARIIGASDSCLEIFTQLMTNISKSSNKDHLAEIFLTLSVLLVREQPCLTFAHLNGIEILMEIIQSNMESVAIISSGLALLKVLCGSDECKRLIGNYNVKKSNTNEFYNSSQLFVNLLEYYITDSNVCKQACALIAALTLRKPDFAKLIVNSGAPEYLIKVLELHQSHSNTIRTACMAIRNCVSRSPELRNSFLGTSDTIHTSANINVSNNNHSDVNQLEQLLNQVMKIPHCNDEAKAALRDLGCHVKFTEPWKGKLPQNISLDEKKH